jgi:hypothetical protein
VGAEFAIERRPTIRIQLLSLKSVGFVPKPGSRSLCNVSVA